MKKGFGIVLGVIFSGLLVLLFSGGLGTDETYRLKIEQPGAMEVVIEGMPQKARLYLGGAPIFEMAFAPLGPEQWRFTPEGGRSFLIRTEKDGAVETTRGRS